ncbi:MAG: molybdate ABC transporter substrate-binding protein [Oscillospiraceae bacterium]|nr:molybdate ABC transporter substrate-binding protein [Oscillospiraceae bacterium]MBR7009376.1 molybdate ABC transporter substrate-binding protein [Oscillospiraceae bacterium]
MKRAVSLLLIAALLCGCLAACGGTEAAKGELTVFAAASLTETLTELGKRFEAAHSGVKVVFNFESSGKLMDQIVAGADCDLFISAAPKQMNLLDAAQDAEKNPERQDFIDSATRLDLLENKVALAVPEGNPREVRSFADLAKRLEADGLLLAMGGEGVPVGQYTQKIFAFFGLDEAALAAAGRLSYGENVKAVTTQVSEKLADCGIIYQTDACSAGLTVVDTATQEMCGRVVYPAALLKGAKNAALARDFLAFLQTDEAGEVFRAVGFTPLAP